MRDSWLTQEVLEIGRKEFRSRTTGCFWDRVDVLVVGHDDAVDTDNRSSYNQVVSSETRYEGVVCRVDQVDIEVNCNKICWM
jgi:hypothetical protein